MKYQYRFYYVKKPLSEKNCNIFVLNVLLIIGQKLHLSPLVPSTIILTIELYISKRPSGLHLIKFWNVNYVGGKESCQFQEACISYKASYIR